MTDKTTVGRIEQLTTAPGRPVRVEGDVMPEALEVTMLKQKLSDMESHMRCAQTVVSTAARNALTALDEDDVDEVREILKSLAGEA